MTQIRDARILIATEQRWGTVNTQWEDAIARSSLQRAVGVEEVQV